MTRPTYKEIDSDVLGAMAPPRLGYYLVMLVLGGCIMTFFCMWLYQVKVGMGIAGISHPVGWGVYIANFVFWVGIAHSGTLISAILHLVRASWRTAVSRAAEAMTIFAIMTAGLFPLIHLGRLWVFYFILPYPTTRQIYPNFTSPLVFDVVAVTTYLTVSVIFFYSGLLPDLAAARDRWTLQAGPDNPRTTFYRRLALGWAGTTRQWRSHGRAYLYFAALATPLVVSVHSVVSWDFAVGILPGWHTTIFPPYFVAGAIHSGLAMVLTLLIPLRVILGLKRLITIDTFDAVAKTMLVTTSIMAYAYIVEPFISWYSSDVFEQQFAWWRATGWLAWAFWLLIPFNILAPLAFIARRARRSIAALLAVSILVNMGMWLERYMIVIGSTGHDFLPHNWGSYAPRWPELVITAGSFTFFTFFFLIFAKLLPTVAASEVKESGNHSSEANAPREPLGSGEKVILPSGDGPGVLGLFAGPDALTAAVRQAQAGGFDSIETFSPFRVESVEKLLAPAASPVRWWTLGGALIGLASGFALAIGTAGVNSLIVGGKSTPIAYIAYCVIGFELTILLGTLGNFTGMLVHGHLRPSRELPLAYDRQCSGEKFGLFVSAQGEQAQKARNLLTASGAEETHVRA